MSLNDRVKVLKTSLSILRDLNAEKAKVDALRTRAHMAKRKRARSDELRGCKRRLIAQSIGSTDLPVPSRELRSKPVAMEKRLDTDGVDEILKDSDWANTLFTPLDTYLGKLETKLLSAWQDAVDAKVPETESMFIQLERLGYQDELSRARTAKLAIRQLREVLPKTDSAMAEVDQHLFTIRTSFEMLRSVPSSVREFLAALAARTATLTTYEGLDKNSRAWLKDHEFLIRIRLNLT